MEPQLISPAPERLGRPSPPTLNDVARLANVSRQTISRVINDKGEVSEATRRRVLLAIEELGYQPNSLARSLKTRTSDAIGLIVPDISRPFYPEVARGVESGATEAGYSVFLCNATWSAERELQALERLRRHRVAGVIIYNSRLDDATLERSVDGAFPVVLVNRDVPTVRGAVVWSGYDVGATLATEHLIAIGRRKLAYLGLEYDNVLDQEKFRGYRTALERASIPFDPERVARAHSDVQGGYTTMAAIAARGVAVDGVFASNDLMAIGALRYAALNGIAVPDDVAIVGFGGLEVAGIVTPTLSTVAVPYHSIGEAAVQELFSLIKGAAHERRHVHAEPELIVRGSTVKERDDGPER